LLTSSDVTDHCWFILLTGSDVLITVSL
jgi:hypothetical protein